MTDRRPIGYFEGIGGMGVDVIGAGVVDVVVGE